MSRARSFPRTVRQALTRTGGYLDGFTHTLQPYVGCQFSCHYCYVREMTVQRANPYQLEWSHWISPKMNIAERLSAHARSGTLMQSRIFCASSTDPYTALERKLRLTRACLEVMVAHPPRALVIQTRSPLVLRDVDLLCAIPTVGVSFTVTTDDDDVRRAFEPDSPSFARRIQTLGALREAGIPTQAAVAPILPCDPVRLANALDPIVDRVVVDDFARGDGAQGRRSRSSFERLSSLGHSAWIGSEKADEALGILRETLGRGRVVVSQRGFNNLEGWLSAAQPLDPVAG
jgi:DNA repair photolyase